MPVTRRRQAATAAFSGLLLALVTSGCWSSAERSPAQNGATSSPSPSIGTVQADLSEKLYRPLLANGFIAGRIGLYCVGPFIQHLSPRRSSSTARAASARSTRLFVSNPTYNFSHHINAAKPKTHCNRRS